MLGASRGNSTWTRNFLAIRIVPVLACGGRRLFDDLGDQHIEWQKTQVLDSPGVTHIRLRAPHTVSAQ